jgi:hypothetical protein
MDNSVEAISCAVRRLVYGTEAMKDYLRSLAQRSKRPRRTPARERQLFDSQSFSLFAEPDRAEEVLSCVRQIIQ